MLQPYRASVDETEGQSVSCPAVRTSSGWLDLFPLPCKKHAECKLMGSQYLCCKGFCTKGIFQQQRANVQAQSSVAQSSSSSTSTTTSTTTTTTTTSTTTTTTTPSTTSSTTTTTTTTPRPQPPATEAPRPFLQLLPIQSTAVSTSKNNAATKTGSNILTSDVTYSHTHNTASIYVDNVDYSSAGKTQKLVCPKSSPVVLFPIPCENNAQCRASSGPGQVCCEGRCVNGIPAPRPTSPPKPHQPLLGVIPRECPTTPLGELLFEVQSCKTDADCWPRICCPDGTRSYCRTAKARLDLVPVARQIDAPVRMLEQYLQCTAPPQFDAFPRPCSSSVDCFPNLCCAEGGKKHCRPPQRSLLALLAGVTQTIGSTLGNLRQAQAQLNRNKV
ncbi:uncharacterized protein ACR2FA_005367 [Aphomia sociella]